jgi:hypothetical protein
MFCLILLLQLTPVLQYHLEFLEDEVMGKPIPPWPPLNKIVLVGSVLLQRPVQLHAVPIMGHPKQSAQPSRHPDLTAHVIVV